MDSTKEKRSTLRRIFMLCPWRHCLAAVSLALIGAYFLLRQNYALTTWVCRNIARPWHRFMSRLCDFAPFSVCGVLIAALVIFFIVYLIITLTRIGKGPGRSAALYRFVLTAAAAIFAIYALFCLLWGTYFYTSDFEAQSGIKAEALSREQLETVTRYFAKLTNEYSTQVERDESGLFAEDLDDIFARSETLYRNVEKMLPCLEGDDLKAKPFMFSKALSYLNFTGFFFPMTAEANVNTHSPACLIPSTIAHELAHQRGVAQEEEANFVAVLASLESGDPAYCYSACLKAFIHLGNALYDIDYDTWLEIHSLLSEDVQRDLADNNEYWDQFETVVAEASDAVYTGLLHSYGQTLGLKSYGACIDLLVAYYYDTAVAEE